MIQLGVDKNQFKKILLIQRENNRKQVKMNIPKFFQCANAQMPPQFSRSLGEDVSCIQSYQGKQGLEFIVYQWNGVNLNISKMRENGLFSLSILSRNQIGDKDTLPKIVTDTLDSPNHYTILSLANGCIVAYQNNSSFDKQKSPQTITDVYEMDFEYRSKSQICGNSLPMNWKDAYAKLAYFSVPSMSNYYHFILGVKYGGGISVFKSQDNFRSFQKQNDFNIQCEFYKYDQINEVFVAIDDKLTIHLFCVQGEHLRRIQIQISDEDQRTLDVDDIDSVVDFDFQFCHYLLQIYLAGKNITLFECDIKKQNGDIQYKRNKPFDSQQSLMENENDDRKLVANRLFTFDHLNLKRVKGYGQLNKFVSLFADKRQIAFIDQEITLVFSRQIFLLSLKNDTCYQILDLNSLINDQYAVGELYLTHNNYQFKKHFAFYGNSNETYHLCTYSNSQSIQEDVQYRPKLFAFKHVSQG